MSNNPTHTAPAEALDAANRAYLLARGAITPAQLAAFDRDAADFERDKADHRCREPRGLSYEERREIDRAEDERWCERRYGQ